MDSLVPGTLLARRYRLLDRIGVGGMSVVWRANDEMLDRIVAVKVLAADLAADARFRELVRTEARAAAALTHPHITATYDYGETFHADGGITSYVVMEFLEGESLTSRLADGPLPWPEAIRVGAEVAEALAAAHRHGIVHRDITADNVMLTRSGVKILDFGIATTVGAPDDDSDGMTFGTPAYVAPERLDGRQARAATDTYALGVLLFAALSGRVPFPAESWDELAEAQRAEPPALAVPGLPDPVTRLCRRCLAPDPQHRPTANQVAWTLRRHLPGAGRARGGPRPAVQRALATAGTAAALLVGVVVGATLLNPGAPPRTTPPTQEQPLAGQEPPGDASPRGAGGPDGASGGEAPARPQASSAHPRGEPGTRTPTTAGTFPTTVGNESILVDDEVTLDTVRALVTDAEDRGDVRTDVARDLRQQITNLEQQLSRGNTDVEAVRTQLRTTVRTRASEGTLAQDTADTLEAALDELTA